MNRHKIISDNRERLAAIKNAAISRGRVTDQRPLQVAHVFKIKWQENNRADVKDNSDYPRRDQHGVGAASEQSEQDGQDGERDSSPHDNPGK